MHDIERAMEGELHVAGIVAKQRDDILGDLAVAG